MKNIKVKLSVGLLFIAFWTYMVMDESLDPEVEKWLHWQPEEVPVEENGFIYFMGLPASEGAEPIHVGQLRGKGLAESEYGAYPLYNDYSEELWIKQPTSELLCGYYQNKCIERYFHSCDAIGTLVAENQTLLKRYRTLLSFEKFSTPIGASPNFELIEILQTGHRLSLLSIAREAQCGDQNVAVERLILEAELLRKQLRIADNIVYKIGLLSLVDQHYWFIAELAKRGMWKEKPVSDNNIFAMLSLAERTLDIPLGRELKQSVTLSSMENLVTEIEYEQFWFPYLFSLVYKENEVMNKTAYQFLIAMHAVNRETGQYRKAKIPADHREPNYYNISNLAGELLMAVSLPRFIDISQHIHELNLSIKLAEIMVFEQQLVRNDQLAQLPSSMRNPFDGSLPMFDSTGKKLCFTSPNKKPEDYTCVNGL